MTRPQRACDNMQDYLPILIIVTIALSAGIYGILKDRKVREVKHLEKQEATQQMETSCDQEGGTLVNIPSSETPWLCLNENTILFKGK